MSAATKRKRGKRKPKPLARRVLLQPPGATFSLAWARDYNSGTASAVKTHPVVRLTEDGPDYGAQLRPGDEIGYGMDPYRTDDCFSAALATALQVPIEQVPDLRLDERVEAGEGAVEISRSSWERVGRWAAGRGLRLTFHEQVPADRERWIGVCPDPKGSWMLGDHCLVMSHGRLVFDPSVSVKCPLGDARRWWSPSDIAYGVSFDEEGVTDGDR